MKNTSKDIFITAKPLSKKISKFISYYYFHQTKDENYQRSFTFYPHYKHALTVYKNSTVDLKEDSSTVYPSKEQSIKSLYTTNNDKSIRVSIKGPFQKT